MESSTLILPIYQIDAFATKAFEGNPAAVIPLEKWLDDSLMQKIAAENNISETVFFVKDSSGKSDFEIRWFTPTIEVKLCGHATMASAHALFSKLDFPGDTIRFSSKSGILIVTRQGNRLNMDFPTAEYQPVENPSQMSNTISKAIGHSPTEIYQSEDLLVVLERGIDISQLDVDIEKLKSLPYRGVLVTVQAADSNTDYDFFARFFAPNAGINEDPATGSAYTLLAPYWASQTGKNGFKARQLSARGADVICELKGDRVHISGSAVTTIEGSFLI